MAAKGKLRKKILRHIRYTSGCNVRYVEQQWSRGDNEQTEGITPANDVHLRKKIMDIKLVFHGILNEEPVPGHDLLECWSSLM